MAVHSISAGQSKHQGLKPTTAGSGWAAAFLSALDRLYLLGGFLITANILQYPERKMGSEACWNVVLPFNDRQETPT